MRFSKTLSLYVVSRLLVNLAYFFLVFALISFIVDFLETIREAQGKNISLSQAMEMVFYKVPFLMHSFLPFIFLFGSILTFTKLNNNFEFAAAKSAGISIWSLCIPISATVIILSILLLTIFQPISAVFLDNNRLLGMKYLNHQAKRVSLQSNGIWLYDQNDLTENSKIIFIKHIANQAETLSDITVYCAGPNEDYTISYLAESATIKDKNLMLTNAKKYIPGVEVKNYKNLALPINLNQDQIQESIPNADIIQFWNLRDFIKKIKKSGFSTLKHEVYYQSMLASPLLYVSLVLIALSCSLNLPRNGKLGIVFVTGGVLGIIIFFLNKISNVMALTGTLPLTLAVLAPSICYLLLSIVALIHCEES